MDVELAELRAEIQGLRAEHEALKGRLSHMEAFSSASFVLLTSLLRDLMAEKLLAPDRAAQLIQAAIAQLRRIYHVTPDAHRAAVGGDKIDYDALSALIAATEQEQPAEELLKTLLEAVQH